MFMVIFGSLVGKCAWTVCFHSILYAVVYPTIDCVQLILVPTNMDDNGREYPTVFEKFFGSHLKINFGFFFVKTVHGTLHRG